ncbi:hypothetical protein [Glaciecola sp. SC05]|uniref:hypothetical protein n=1 Tax=Glaciecola sp. SC05 TaxID=1987355 RepID=UPI003527F3CD
MQNPFQRLDNALRKSHVNKRNEPSKFVAMYEMITFLLVIPSILVFQIGFVFVVINIWISSQIAKNRFVLSGISIVIVNLLALPVAYFYWLGLNANFSIVAGAALFISLSLTLAGLVALYTQKTRQELSKTAKK